MLAQLSNEIITLMFARFNFGWAAQLSIRRMISPLLDGSSLYHFLTSSSKVIDTIQAFCWECYSQEDFFTFLKRLKPVLLTKSFFFTVPALLA